MSGVQQRSYVRNMDDVKYEKIALMHVNGKAMAVYEWMAHAMGKSNALIVPMCVLCDFFACDKRTMERHVRFLRDNNLIHTEKTGASNIYFVNSKVFRWDSKAPIFKFSASVIISDDKASKLSKRIKSFEKLHSDEINQRKVEE